jgi:large subunit ribosomal protein L10
VDKSQKEQVVAELAERLRTSDTLIVADYRGLTMPQIDALRGELLKHGARFQVVKNTLTRRAAEVASSEHLLAMLEGPTAIAFVEAEGDAAAVAKALAAAAKETQVIEIRGGVMQGRAVTAAEIETLATLPSLDVLRSQVLGAITSPLTVIVALFNAPLQNLIGLIDARIEQLGGETPAAVEEAPVEAEHVAEVEVADAPVEAAQAAEVQEPAEEEAQTTEADATASAEPDVEPTETTSEEPETTTPETED